MKNVRQHPGSLDDHQSINDAHQRIKPIGHRRITGICPPMAWLGMVLLLLAHGGCSDDGQGEEQDQGHEDGLGDNGDAAPDPDAVGDAPMGDGGDESGESDAPDDADTSVCGVCTGGTCLVSVAGTVQDEAGEPVEGAMAQLCIRVAPSGVLRCLRPSEADEDGVFGISISKDLRCVEHAVIRIVKPLARSVSLYCPLDLSGGEPNLTIGNPFLLYATTAATTVPPAGEPAQVHTVVFEDGLEVDVVPERFYAGDEGFDTLASRHFSGELPDLCFLADSPSLLGLYGFSPESEVDGAGFVIRIPNSTELAAGTLVDLFLLGGLSTTLSDESTVSEGEWRLYGQAAVNQAESFIEVPADPGLPHFLWLGYGEHAE